MSFSLKHWKQAVWSESPTPPTGCFNRVVTESNPGCNIFSGVGLGEFKEGIWILSKKAVISWSWEAWRGWNSCGAVVGLVGSIQLLSLLNYHMIIWFMSVYLETGAVLNWHQLVWMKHEGGKSSDDGYFHHEYRAFEPRPSRKSFDVPSRLVFFLESSICTTFLNTLDLLCLAKKWSNDDEILGSSSQAPSRSNWKGLGLCFSTILYLCFVPMLDHGCRWN